MADIAVRREQQPNSLTLWEVQLGSRKENPAVGEPETSQGPLIQDNMWGPFHGVWSPVGCFPPKQVSEQSWVVGTVVLNIKCREYDKIILGIVLYPRIFMQVSFPHYLIFFILTTILKLPWLFPGAALGVFLGGLLKNRCFMWLLPSVHAFSKKTHQITLMVIFREKTIC